MAEQQAPQRRKGRGGRERILAAANALFEAQGINATSMEQVAAAAPVSKRTLYAHFPTKDDLVVGHLRELVESGRTLEGVFDRTDLTPEERILALFAAPGHEPIRGCPFIDAAAEFPDPASPVHEFAAEQKRRLATRLTELTSALGATNPTALAEQLAVLVDGAASRSMALNDRDCLEHAKAAAQALLAASTSATPG
ncbi:regulatory protein, tetR family [Saccharopolyspora antimicrobica]|uniref:Regulatory protein, tetR family n=1 Tax=Saccharopolyspora antimicrobica TaxID=455193 RepID=A0A1I4U563_9PSEU|nr:TetR family transcriptional regulator [Saccharopolyspora antimicrobica]RKT88684.1 TetR family transcriptional regulator [Saccharopolyspora antimicrobica]SFM83970.1 regulatory protein, tetR family [Saccharopolyspora antimicrobica]